MAIYTFEQALKKTGAKPSQVKSVDTSVTPQPTEQPAQPGYIDRVTNNVGEDINNRVGRVQDILNRPDTGLITKGVQAFGQGAGMAANALETAVGEIPGVKQVTGAIGSGINTLSESAPIKAVGNAIGSNKTLQDIVTAYDTNPNVRDSIDAFANTVRLGTDIQGGVDAGVGAAKLATGAVKTVAGVASDTAGAVKSSLSATPEQIAAERAAKITKGFEEQNIRLKTADKSFTKNTIIRKTPDGKTTKITPIDTFAKHGIAPTIEKGSIQMGDYKTGTGELGKIKVKVEALDNEIDTKLVNTGKKISVEELKQKAIDNAMKNEEFRQSGSVSQNVAKIENRFEDYKKSYGDQIDIAELNNIRKTANKDYAPDTQDVSRIVGDTAREVVYNATPDGAVKKLLQQQGELLAAKKYAETINGTKVAGGRLGNMALRTTGAIIGSALPKSSVIGSIVGAMGGEFAARALQQSQFKSLWTELRALLNQSKSIEQSASATTIPNKVIGQENIKTIPSNSAKPTNTSSRIMSNSVPQKGIVGRAIDRIKNTPNKQGGFIKIPGPKVHPEDLRVMSDVTDYVAGSYKPGPKLAHQLEIDASRIAEHYKFPRYTTLRGLANYFGKVLEHYNFKGK